MTADAIAPAHTNVHANPFRAALARGRPLVGLWSMLNSSSVLEGLGWAGFDWLLIDGEHAPVSLGDALDHLRAMSATPAVPVLRLAENDRTLLKRHLDIGARTIMLPFIQTPEEAAEAVRAMRYPPDGVRGYAAMHRASRYAHLPDYVRRAAEGLFLIVQVETVAALDKLDAIAAVPGVDAVFFGPGDLAASMGRLGQAGDEVVTLEIEAAHARVKAAGKATGVLAPNPDLAARYIRAGLDFVAVGTDCGLLFGQAGQAAERFRKLADGSA